MSFPAVFFLFLAGLIVSAHTRYHGIPVLWLVAAATVLTVAAIVLYLIRQIMQDRPVPHPAYRPVYVVTTLT